MFYAFELLDTAASRPLLVGIPESAGLLIFGFGLVSAAVILRWVLARNDKAPRGKDLTK